MYKRQPQDALNYAIVGCVELTTHGNNLGWSDAAMFNLNKALELTLNHGKCLLNGNQIGLSLIHILLKFFKPYIG